MEQVQTIRRKPSRFVDKAREKDKPEIKEIWHYKRKLQAYMIHFERVGQVDMVKKIQAADALLDDRLKDLLLRKKTPV